MNTVKLQQRTRSMGILCLTFAFVCLLTACGGGNPPSAPTYATDLMDATTVEWVIEGDEIGGHYDIDHPGDSDHTYEVVLYIVSGNGKKFVSSGTPGSMFDWKSGGWSDTAESARNEVDWSTAEIWCEILIYDDSGDLVFHGVKTSGRFPSSDLIETEEE